MVCNKYKTLKTPEMMHVKNKSLQKGASIIQVHLSIVAT